MADNRRAAEPQGEQDRGASRRQGENEGWALFSYLVAGMGVYGGIGALIDRWTHASLYFPVGMLVGLALAIVLIIYRYGRS
jgi:ATP synthase protein I